MTPSEAWELGYRSASSGFFFDSMELLATTSTRVGGFEVLRGAIELIFAQKDEVNDHMAWVSRICSQGFNTAIAAPTGVDEYRLVLTQFVFEIVNRWSYIADIKTVTRLQAWFYAGFGLGRATTALRGVQLFERVREVAGLAPPVDQVPSNLAKLSMEASRQMEIASAEDDFRNVRPLLEDCARRASALAMQLQGDPQAILFSAQHELDLEFFADTLRKLRMDVARISLN